MNFGSACDNDQAIVALGFAFLRLLRFNRSNQPAGNETTREGGLIHQDQCVERIPIAAEGRWNKAEIIGKRRSYWEDPSKLKDALLLIVFKLVAASFWS